MKKKEFIEKIKTLAVDFWTMNLHNGTFEEELKKIVKERDKKKKRSKGISKPKHDTLTNSMQREVKAVYGLLEVGDCVKCIYAEGSNLKSGEVYRITKVVPIYGGEAYELEGNKDGIFLFDRFVRASIQSTNEYLNKKAAQNAKG